MPLKLDLEVVSPNRVVFSGKVDRVSLPSDKGQITILPKHISLFSPVVEGELKIIQDDKTHYLSIGKGIVEVGRDKVSVLIEDARHLEEINEEKVLEAIEAAKKAIKEEPKGEDLISAKAVFRRSLVDLKVARRKKRRADLPKSESGAA